MFLKIDLIPKNRKIRLKYILKKKKTFKVFHVSVYF